MDNFCPFLGIEDRHRSLWHRLSVSQSGKIQEGSSIEDVFKTDKKALRSNNGNRQQTLNRFALKLLCLRLFKSAHLQKPVANKEMKLPFYAIGRLLSEWVHIIFWWQKYSEDAIITWGVNHKEISLQVRFLRAYLTSTRCSISLIPGYI